MGNAKILCDYNLYSLVNYLKRKVLVKGSIKWEKST